MRCWFPKVTVNVLGVMQVSAEDQLSVSGGYIAGKKVLILHMHFYYTADRHLHSPLLVLCHHTILNLFSCRTSVTSFLFS